MASANKSPPLTWRKDRLKELRKKKQRITSTYVEKSLPPSITPEDIRDHLHLRGEKKGRDLE